LSENLQNWLHDRGTGRPPRIARNAAAAAPAQPEREPGAFDESAGAIRSRRMRSFDEAGITVISNRLSQSPDALTRVAPARVAGPAPRPPRPEPTEVEPELEREAERELDREPRRVTQTRSLRAARFAGPKHAFEDGFGWATLAAGGSALGLAALWFRRRGRVPRS
jgi:hypothetical protein